MEINSGQSRIQSKMAIRREGFYEVKESAYKSDFFKGAADAGSTFVPKTKGVDSSKIADKFVNLTKNDGAYLADKFELKKELNSIKKLQLELNKTDSLKGVIEFKKAYAEIGNKFVALENTAIGVLKKASKFKL